MRTVVVGGEYTIWCALTNRNGSGAYQSEPCRLLSWVFPNYRANARHRLALGRVPLDLARQHYRRSLEDRAQERTAQISRTSREPPGLTRRRSGRSSLLYQRLRNCDGPGVDALGAGTPPAVPNFPAAPSLHRVPRVGSPASSVPRAAPTSCRPSRCTSVVPCTPVPPASTETARSPQVPGEPHCSRAAFSDPGGPAASSHDEVPVLPSDHSDAVGVPQQD